MRVLFDHNIPSGTARALVHHQVTEAIDLGWQRISNGQLIANAEQAGFDVFLTADKRIPHQQNLKGRRLATIVIGNPTWRILQRHPDRVTAAVEAATPGSYTEVEISFE